MHVMIAAFLAISVRNKYLTFIARRSSNIIGNFTLKHPIVIR